MLLLIEFFIIYRLDAKKRGHSVYSFVRNEDYYNEITGHLSKQINFNIINNLIISRNMSLFAKILENCDELDKITVFIKQKDNIIQFLQETGWKKGEKLFNLFLESWQ